MTSPEAAKLDRDKARGRTFSVSEVVETARAVNENVTFQEQADYGLSAAETFALLNEYVRRRTSGDPDRASAVSKVARDSVAGSGPSRFHRDGVADNLGIEKSPFGPTGQSPVLTNSLT